MRNRPARTTRLPRWKTRTPRSSSGSTSLEGLAKKEGLMPSGTATNTVMSALDKMTISGFVQASYFYNLDPPASGYYRWLPVEHQG